MRAMVLQAPGQPLVPVERALPDPGPGEVRVRVMACGVCRTDLHLVDGEVEGRLPVVPGHEVVGRIDALGPGVTDLAPGQRVGIPWLGGTCGTCRFCRDGAENLCDAPAFTGCHRDGGYATHALADARFVLPLDDDLDDIGTAPLLCAGLIGWRALKAAGDARVLGLYGFGAAAHLVAQVARAEGRTVLAFTRPGDVAAQRFARQLGCAFAAGADEAPPEPMDAAILFAPAGELVPTALAHVRKGGRVVCGGIHMSDIPGFPYRLLWGERRVESVANLTRADGREFLAVAARLGLRAHAHARPLAEANEALDDLRQGRVTGALVLVP
ncbi:MAG: zinc-dependent alcohol dehydrogenase family protein [Sphingomonadaceae bacterium]|nr:zinc-dependent alcohol dehydrogenase family protein [Thermaurantiacus sp.]MCS6987298.1 zinc-dependent alcohol dehydrogenase family protein [Sphingomonadaceae bacterium]MDW8414518.1 zinc-dependent alcohol dehydrogenase family protein [Thermaurantiacus sp.]